MTLESTVKVFAAFRMLVELETQKLSDKDRNLRDNLAAYLLNQMTHG